MIEYELIRKKIKNVYIGVKNGKVIVRAPIRLSKQKVDELINQKSKWINDKLQKQINHENFELVNKEHIYILGKKIKIEYKEAKKISIELNINSCVIYSPKLTDEVYSKILLKLDKNLKDLAYEYIIPIVKKDNNCVGVILLTGKKEDKQSLSKSYWEQDIEFINLFTEIITRISEADNERMTFLNQLGHELLTPITEIVQQNDFLFNKYTLRKESFDKNAVMRQLQSNINNCLLFQYIISDIEHIYSSSVKDISYNIELQNEPWEILQDIVNLFRTSIPIKMSISQMPPMYLDKERIKQVFINILKNAIRYSYDGQQIEIYYKSVEYENVKMHEIKFVNYGIGILEEDKEHIFELYKRGRNATEKRASGSGMGLYIVQEIMKAHGGMCIIRKLKDPTEISLLFPYK